MQNQIHDFADQDRIIGVVGGQSLGGPTIVCFGGMHGNEPSGVAALELIVKEYSRPAMITRGSLIALKGNVASLKLGTRYQEKDLNRMWTPDRMEALRQGDLRANVAEDEEQIALYKVLVNVLKEYPGPFYFVDLHTTSSATKPFVVMNDCLLNRRFVRGFPVPKILGIEEFIEGPLLSEINAMGYVAFGFESGQHEDPKSVDRHEDFVKLVMYRTGMIAEEPKQAFQSLYAACKRECDFFEIFFRYRIKEGEKFEMFPGYKNFQHIAKGQPLAYSNGKVVIADRDAAVFMPLYQSQGSEGFFAIRLIPRWAILLSAWLRMKGMSKLLTLLPGVRWREQAREVLLVDTRVASFLTKQIFHLFGFRSRRLDRNHFVMDNREANTRYKDYANEPWY